MIDPRFQRNQILLGEDYLDKIKDKRILVFGVGGVGGSCVDALARIGFRHFALVDFDEVNLSNINRQVVAKESSVGKKKVDVMEDHLHELNPQIKVEKIPSFYLPENALGIEFSSFDYVIDCCDTIEAKVDIIMKCKEAGVPLISSMGCGNRLDPRGLTITTLEKTSSDPLAKIMRKRMKDLGIENVKVLCSANPPLPKKMELEQEGKKRPIGSSPFVPPIAGIMIAYEVSKDLLGF